MCKKSDKFGFWLRDHGSVRVSMDCRVKDHHRHHQFICHTQTQLTVISISKCQIHLCYVTGSNQAYAPHKQATHVQWTKLNIFITIQRLQEKKIKKQTYKSTKLKTQIKSKRQKHMNIPKVHNCMIRGRVSCRIVLGWQEDNKPVHWVVITIP